jgi:hypothetical protein
MTDAEKKQLVAAMEKALSLHARVEKLTSELPPERRNSTTRMRMAAHSAVVNLAAAMKATEPPTH